MVRGIPLKAQECETNTRYWPSTPLKGGKMDEKVKEIEIELNKQDWGPDITHTFMLTRKQKEYLLSLLSEKEKDIIKQDAKLRLQSTLVVSLERRIKEKDERIRELENRIHDIGDPWGNKRAIDRIKELKDQLAYIKRKYDILG